MFCTLYQMSISIWSKLWPKLYIWPWRITLTAKMCDFLRYIQCMSYNIKCLSLLNQKLCPMLKWAIWPIFFTFDLEGWPWPWHITSIVTGLKSMANVKVADIQTNRQTDNQTGQKHYAPLDLILLY